MAAEADGLHGALAQALAGRPDGLEALLCRHGGGHDRRPNLKLAAAFGAEVSAVPFANVAPLLARFTANDAAPDTAEVFLPIAAAYGWTARLAARPKAQGAEEEQWLGAAPHDGGLREQAWLALQELARDERAPVRLGTREALIALGAERGASALLERAASWIEDDHPDADHDRRFGSAALMLEVLSHTRVLATVSAPDRLFDYMSRVLDAVAGAPRSAERLDSRRRLLLSLAPACATIAARSRGGDRGVAWLEQECVRAKHPDVRGALSDALLRLRSSGAGVRPAELERLRHALAGSAKPPRDPTRRRPGHGRGKASRRIS